MEICRSEKGAAIQPVGNDIVDLLSPGNREKYRDRRFKNRVFTSGEQDRLDKSDDPDRLLWSFWTAKETAYKILVKIAPKVKAIPCQYDVLFTGEIGVDSILPGIVSCPWGMVTVRLFSLDSYLHCVGTAGREKDLKGIVHGVSPIGSMEEGGNAESTAVRRILTEELAHELGVAVERLSVIRLQESKGLRYPVLLLDGRPMPLDISISHDGGFAAFARTRHLF